MRCSADTNPRFIRFISSDKGLTVTEYAVAAGLIAATMTVAFLNLGLTIDAIILAVMAFM
jgi:Flp pilus assembly pilin Flp